MKVNIHHEGKQGWVQYDSIGKEIMITHPNELVRNTVRDYLNTDREVTVPASNDVNKVGHRKLITITPLSKVSHLEMALTEMYHATGVHVNWGAEGSEGASDTKLPSFGNKADKPIAKSLLNDDFYEIIN